jgi:hypothetical protein
MQPSRPSPAALALSYHKSCIRNLAPEETNPQCSPSAVIRDQKRTTTSHSDPDGIPPTKPTTEILPS